MWGIFRDGAMSRMNILEIILRVFVVTVAAGVAITAISMIDVEIVFNGASVAGKLLVALVCFLAAGFAGSVK